MDLPILNINEIPDLDIVIGTMGSSVSEASSAGTGELLLIVATYFWENAQSISMLL